MIYPSSGRRLCNTLRPMSLWIVLMRDLISWGGPLPVLYSLGGKVTDLRNPIPANYNSHIRRGYDIYPNRLGFLDHQVVSACSARFVEQSGDPCGPFWQVDPPYLAWPMRSHEGIRVYTPTVSPRALCILKDMSSWPSPTSEAWSPEAPDQKGGLLRNIPSLPTSSADSRPPHLSENALSEKCMVLWEKRKIIHLWWSVPTLSFILES
jgi:hypothetical protein